ncbi:hypothetical protein ACWD48_14450 [Streptomyces sp. NPDC002519]
MSHMQALFDEPPAPRPGHLRDASRLASPNTDIRAFARLDHGLELDNRSVDILARVQSTRAKDYVPS